MTFINKGITYNLLDTPGHEDFSEDTYRVLTAVDSAIMVLDCAKGIESQTRKLFEVCRLRDMPIITFINKMDRDGQDPFDLLDELESHIADPGVSLAAQQALEIDFGQAFAAFRAGDYAAASARLAAMETRVRSLAGSGIPNEWEAGQVFPGEAGEMISFIRSAIFHLGRLAAPP